MPDSEQGAGNRPPLLRKRTGSKQVITSRHRSAHSHSRLNKVVRIAPMTSNEPTTTTNGKFTRSKSMDHLALQQHMQKKVSPGHVEEEHHRRAGLTRASRSQSKIAGTSSKMTGATANRRPGKAVMSIGTDHEDSEDDSEFSSEEDVKQKQPSPVEGAKLDSQPVEPVRAVQSDPTLLSSSSKMPSDDEEIVISATTQRPLRASESDAKDPIEDSVPLEASTTSIDALSSMLNKSNLQGNPKTIEQTVSVSNNSDTEDDEDLAPSTPIRPTISDESLKPSRQYTDSPAQPQISNETVLAIAPGSASLSDSASSTSGFGTPNHSTSITKSHFLDGSSSNKTSTTSPVRTLRSGKFSAPVLSRTQSSFGIMEDASKRMPPTSSASFTRTQQKLWLQRESMDQQAVESIENMSFAERKKEDDRITKEYINVTRFANPLQDALKRVQRARNQNAPIHNPKRIPAKNNGQLKKVGSRVSDDRLGLSQSFPKSSSLSLSETTITVPHGLQGQSSTLESDEARYGQKKPAPKIFESQINWHVLKSGESFYLSDFPSALSRLWTIPFEDPSEAAENAKVESIGSRKNSSPSILAQAQQAQQQMMLAQKMQAQKQQQAQRQAQIGQMQQQPNMSAAQLQHQQQYQQAQQQHHQQQRLQQQQQAQQQQNMQQLPATKAQGRGGNTAGAIRLG